MQKILQITEGEGNTLLCITYILKAHYSPPDLSCYQNPDGHLIQVQF